MSHGALTSTDAASTNEDAATLAAAPAMAPGAALRLAGTSARAMRDRVRIDDEHQPYIDLLDAVALSAVDNPKAYQRVRARQRQLQQWFAQHTGWLLQVTSDHARLLKAPARTHAGLALEHERPLSAREYAMVVWVLWYAEKAVSDQASLLQLAREIQARANALLQQTYIDWNQRQHRAALVTALQAMEELGLIVRVDGDFRPYADDSEADVLWEYTALATQAPVMLSEALYLNFLSTRDVGLLDRLPPADAALSIRAYRTLLLLGVVTAADEPQVFAWVRHQQQHIDRELRTHFGWVLEVTPGYAVALRTTQDTGGRAAFPTNTVAMALPLLLSVALRTDVAAGHLVPDPVTDSLTISRTRLEGYMADLRRDYSQHWSTALRELDAVGLADRTIELLRQWGMLHGPTTTNEYVLLPILARYGGTYREDGYGLGMEGTAEAEDAIDS
jgi:uncharacterized protein (TIGR02678 family)